MTFAPTTAENDAHDEIIYEQMFLRHHDTLIRHWSLQPKNALQLHDAEKAYEGLRKGAMPGNIRDPAGYETATNGCGGGMR